MPSSGIDVGDAVLSFIGDTTQLDQTWASLPGKAQAGIGPIQTELDEVSGGLRRVASDADETLGVEVPEAAELTRKQVSEARGEVRLLGEEFGIRLPRHVANFVADMPGVGQALSAAFSATAVLFLIEALVKATEKLSDWVGGMLIYTAAQKAAYGALVANNLEVAKQVAIYNTAKQAIEDFGKTAVEKTQGKIEELTTSLIAHQKQLATLQDLYNRLNIHNPTIEGNILLIEKTIAAEKEQLDLEAKIISQQKDDAALKAKKADIELTKQLTETQIKYKEALGLDKDNADEQRYQASLKALKALAAVEAEYNGKDIAEVKKANAAVEAAEVDHFKKLHDEAEKAKTDLSKTFAAMQKEVGKDTVGALDTVKDGLPPVVEGLLKMRAAARSVGVTLREDLVKNLNAAEIAKNQFVSVMGTKDAASINQFDTAIHKAQLALKHFNEEAKKGKLLIIDDKTAMQEFQQTSLQAAQSLGDGVSKAFSAMIDHQQSFGKAMEKSTFEMLATMAEKWGAFYIAKGIADIWLNPAAAAEELAGGTALEVLGGVLSGLGSKGGAGGSSASTTQSQSSSVDTGGSTRSTIGITGVQKFAMGGLISAPTLAVIGENPGESEAVLPLDNPKSMARIGKSVADATPGGGGGIHVHVKGMVSPDNLGRVIGQINRRVGQGRSNLVASNSFRITKRSA